MTPLRRCLHLSAHLPSRWKASPTAAAPPAWLHLSVCPALEQKKHFSSSCCCGSSLLGPSKPFCCFIFSLQCPASHLLPGGCWVCEAPASSTTSRAVARFTATSIVWAAGEEPGKLYLFFPAAKMHCTDREVWMTLTWVQRCLDFSCLGSS